MISSVFNNAEISNILSLLMKIYNYNNSNSGNNSKCSKLISFSINDRSGHFEQLTKVIMIIQSIFNNAEIGNILKC